MIGNKIAIANIRNDYPYGMKIIDNKWYLVNRGYDKISAGYILSDDSINKIVSIAVKLKGNRIETEKTKTIGIWFYNDGFWKESKVYLEKYYESIKSVYKCLDEN